MTSDLDDLWNEFAAETDDHLESIERLLSERQSVWSDAEIGALFRYFHSLKGSFLAMGFSNVEAVAHRCEDVLSLVRDGKIAIDRSLARLLLRAVDHLKEMRDEVLATRQDCQPAVALLAELDVEQRDDPSRTASNASTNVKGASLGDDAEMVAIYSELLDQRLPLAAQALSPNAAERQMAVATLSELAYGAEMLGFDSLSERLGALGKLADAKAPETGEMVDVFSDIHEQVKIIAELTNRQSGAESLATALRPLLKPYCAACYADLKSAAARDDETEILTALTKLRATTACQGFEQLGRTLILVEESFRAIDERPPTANELVRETVDQLETAIDSGSDLQSTEAQTLFARWDQSIRGERTDTQRAENIAALLSPEQRATLSSEQRAKLEHALNNRQTIAELLLDVESHPEVAGDVLAWISTSVQAITSHTAHRHGAGCFDFLIVCDHPLNWVQAQLAALDPEQVCLRGIKTLGEKVTQGPSADNQAAASRTPLVRVSSDKIDDLMAEIGDMRSALATFADLLQNGQIVKSIRDRKHYDGQNPLGLQHGQDLNDAVNADLRGLRELHDALEGAHRRIWSIGLQLRVVPVDALFGRLSRAVRDLAEKLGKEVDVVVDGREVRIDKSMVDILIDPLMHMVRNAVDHGIETPSARQAAGKPRRATVTIAGRESGNRVEIIISDDGRGLDRAKIIAKAINMRMISAESASQMTDAEINSFIFRPGFSTAGSVSEISGRGVGLDVVETTLQRLGGTIEIESSTGVGTRFILKLPVSAALLRTLLVEVEGRIFAFPERQVIAVRDQTEEEIQRASGQIYMLHRGAAVPVRQLGRALGFPERRAADTMSPGHLVLVTTGSRAIGLSVDRVLRFQDLFLKDLHPALASVAIIAGASVLGDGRPVLVLDCASLGNVEMEEPLTLQ